MHSYKGILKITCLASIGLLILSSSYADVIPSSASNAAAANWTLMLYLDGDNQLSSLLQQRVQQIASVGTGPTVEIAILFDGNENDDTKLYYLDGTSLQEQQWDTESDMSSGDTISTFANKVMNDLEATQYCLSIISNKGSGWQGVCWDDHGDGIMITMTELLTALNTITDNGANKLDVLHIESCLCGNFELRYQVRS